MRKQVLGVAAPAALAAVFLAGAQFHAARPPSKPLSMARSFEVTDKPIVSTPAFTLDHVLTQLVQRSGAASVTPQQLLRQMFDTQNPKPGLADASAPHCDDTILNGQPSFVDPIIQTQFAPHRMQILQDFLRSGTPPVHSK